MARTDDFVQLILGLEEARPGKGMRLVGPRFEESFHPWREIVPRVLALAGRFQAQGVVRGQSILVAMSTDMDAIGSLLALVTLGAVPFSVTSPLMGQDREAHRARIADLIRLHRVERILACKDFLGLAGSLGAPSMEVTGGWDEAAAHPPAVPVTVRPDDVAFVQFSSGSTANPKGIRITHRNLLVNMQLILDADRRTEDSVWVSWLPLYHDMGLVGGFLSNFILRNDLVLMHPRCFMTRPVSWLAAISKWGGTTTAVPNFSLDICSERIPEEQLREHRIDLHTFRYIHNGSEPVVPASVRRFEERFLPYGFAPGGVRPVYGMSEATLIITAPDYDEPMICRRIGGMDVPSVGRPLGDFRIRIRDPHRAELPPGEVGEIWVHGTSLTPGYLQAPGSHEGPGRDGWFATGDLGLLDEEGRLYVTGRKKDLIIHQGQNFYGHEIAARVEEVSGARRGKVFVFGARVDNREEVVVMTTPPRKGGEGGREAAPGGIEEFKAEIRRIVLREFGVPVYDVCIVSQIPKTTSGKVVRHRCAEIYEQQRLGLGEPGRDGGPEEG